MKASARREDGTLQHAVEMREPHTGGGRAQGRGRRRRRAEPAGAAGGKPRLLHRDHHGDVRQAQGLGGGRRGRPRGLRAGPARLPHALSHEASTSPRRCPRSSASASCRSAPSAPCTGCSRARSCSRRPSSSSDQASGLSSHIDDAPERPEAEALVDRVAERRRDQRGGLDAALGGVGESVAKQVPGDAAAARLGQARRPASTSLLPSWSVIRRQPTGSPFVAGHVDVSPVRGQRAAARA